MASTPAPAPDPLERMPQARLRAFEVHNHRIFKHERLEVHPSVTVLVGLNDSGKSTLLNAIRLYGIITHRTGFRGPLSDEQFSGTGEQATRFVAEWLDADGNVWTHSLTLDATAPEERLSSGERFLAWNPKTRRLDTEQGAFEAKNVERYTSLTQIETKRWQLDTEVPEAIHEPLSTTQSFRTPEAYLFEPSDLARPAPISRTRPARNGFAWSNWLQDIINRRNDDIGTLERDIRALFPFFGSVSVREQRIQIQREEREIGSGRVSEPRAVVEKRRAQTQASERALVASDASDMLDHLSDLQSTREAGQARLT